MLKTILLISLALANNPPPTEFQLSQIPELEINVVPRSYLNDVMYLTLQLYFKGPINFVFPESVKNDFQSCHKHFEDLQNSPFIKQQKIEVPHKHFMNTFILNLKVHMLYGFPKMDPNKKLDEKLIQRIADFELKQQKDISSKNYFETEINKYRTNEPVNKQKSQTLDISIKKIIERIKDLNNICKIKNKDENHMQTISNLATWIKLSKRDLYVTPESNYQTYLFQLKIAENEIEENKEIETELERLKELNKMKDWKPEDKLMVEKSFQDNIESNITPFNNDLDETDFLKAKNYIVKFIDYDGWDFMIAKPMDINITDRQKGIEPFLKYENEFELNTVAFMAEINIYISAEERNEKGKDGKKKIAKDRKRPKVEIIVEK